MPWQQYVADVSHEVDPLTGLLWYREVIIEIPRQSGKTTLGLTVRVHRATGPFGGPQMLLYTAQTRNDARQKWEDEHLPLLQPAVRSRPQPPGQPAELLVVRHAHPDLHSACPSRLRSRATDTPAPMSLVMFFSIAAVASQPQHFRSSAR